MDTYFIFIDIFRVFRFFIKQDDSLCKTTDLIDTLVISIVSYISEENCPFVQILIDISDIKHKKGDVKFISNNNFQY